MLNDVNNPDLSIIIVSWNVKDLLEGCLRSLDHHRGDLNLEIIVVDNASADGSADMVADLFPHVICERLDRNIGFGAGNNVAMKRASAPYFLLLNPDTIVLTGTLQSLLEFMKNNERCGAVGPQILTPRMTIDRSCRRFPTMPAALYQFTAAKYFLPLGPSFHRYMMREFDHTTTRNVDQIMGACMGLRREVYDVVGGFDENFFMFYEEVDWCRRIIEAGFTVTFQAETAIIHYSDRSTAQIWDEMLLHKINSLFYFFSKTRSIAILKAYRPFFLGLFLLKCHKDRMAYAIKAFIATAMLNLQPEATHRVRRAEKYRTRYKQISSFLTLFRQRRSGA